MLMTIALVSISLAALATAVSAFILSARLTRALNLHFADAADSLDRLADVIGF
jgi:hypothetical protein